MEEGLHSSCIIGMVKSLCALDQARSESHSFILFVVGMPPPSENREDPVFRSQFEFVLNN